MSEHVSLPQGSPCPDEQRHALRVAELPTQSAALVPKIQVDMPARADRVISNDAIPVLDTAKFEHMYRVATAIAQSSLVPESLRMDSKDRLPDHVVIANCFRVVNQAVRWGMDPFALIDCASIIKGRLCWEGKVIAAVLDATLGIELEYEYEGQGELLRITVKGNINGKDKTVHGTVAQWKTTGNGSPWKPADYERQLAYRGNREWARRHKPSVLLGVYGSDERFEDDAPPMKDVTPPAAPPPRRTPPAKGYPPTRPLLEPDQIANDESARQIGIRQEIDETTRQTAVPPETPPPRRAVKGKKPESLPAHPEDAIDDEEERRWVKGLRGDAAGCRSADDVRTLLERRQSAMGHLSDAARKIAVGILDQTASDLQR